MQNKMENYGQKLDKGRPKKWNNNKKNENINQWREAYWTLWI